VLINQDEMKNVISSSGKTFIIFFLLFQVNIGLIYSQDSWKASPEVVASASKGRPEFNFDETKVPYFVLPDVLKTKGGQIIESKKEWLKIRRPELEELFTSQMFGRIPGTLFEKRFNVVKSDENAMNGIATLRQVDIIVSSAGKSITIHLGLFIPNKAKKPVPAFLLICNRSSDNIDFTREKKSEFWPAEEVIARGYAIAAFNNADVDPDNFDEFKNGIHGVLDRSRNEESWGTLAAWAWGASRCLDYLETEKNIDGSKVAVVGHSRGGKTALWAGATDQRFAMVVSNEAGCGGSSLARRRFGETIERITKSFPHWFCGNYKKFSNREDEFPVDQHELMALIAPGALYVASADKDLWGDPRGQYLALFHSQPVFRLWDKKISLPEIMPPLNTPVHSGQIAYHIRDGEHNLLLKDWNWFMDFGDVVLKH
jgi:hypothetical protein